MALKIPEAGGSAPAAFAERWSSERLCRRLWALHSPAPPRPPPVSIFQLIVSLALCLAASGAAQEGSTSALERARAAHGSPTPEAPALGGDDLPLEPGALPADASKEARAAWLAAVERSAQGDAVRSFRLHFYLRQRSAGQLQTNDLELDFSYLVPGLLRAELETGRTHLRGPAGDFLIDGKELVPLVGREGAEDRKQIEEMASLARNFVALSNPRNLRIRDLAILPTAPASLAGHARSVGAGLDWLRVSSPDFFLPAAAPGIPAASETIYTVDLGLDPVSHTIRYALVREELLGDGPLAPPLLVRLDQHADRDGFWVPHRIELYALEGTALGEIAPAGVPASGARFAARATSELTLKRSRGSLRAGLSPDDFRPPSR